MTDYSKLSDFEINCEVLAVFSPDIKHMSLSGDNSCFYDCGPTGDGWNQIDIPDFCNNPADAWPIISANRISVEYDAEHQCDVPAEWVTAYGIDDLKVHIVAHQPCDKALRSAMIVFLMMQGASHANS
ncbi:phage protein NinX family protein [Atlantibacter hermannii]|uniref:phage protein NinX family protein n=2 Tax=Atlantibacter hermannii TaxID=565 RepID=UPI00331818F1